MQQLVIGHQDEKSFRRYVKLSQSYKTSKMLKAFSNENMEEKMREMENVE